MKKLKESKFFHVKTKIMKKYIKKSVEPREAWQLTEKNQEEIMEWCGGKKGLDGSILFKTPESHGETQMAVTGDYIMKAYSENLGWHFYPIKPDYMEENYKEI
jgi:hypothetical protein